MIEVAIARTAAENIAAKKIHELRRINKQMSAEAEDAEKASSLNQDFHLTICDAGGNRPLRIVLEGFMGVTDARIVGVTYTRKEFAQIVAAHEEIIEALSSGDATKAGEAMDSHIAAAYRFWRRRYTGVFDHPVRWMQ